MWLLNETLRNKIRALEFDYLRRCLQTRRGRRVKNKTVREGTCFTSDQNRREKTAESV
jgi:hypothetical protein